MNYSEIFKRAILNLYKDKVYTVDYAILKATDYADKGKLNAEDYEELMNYFISEQEKEVKEEVSEEVVEDTVVEEDSEGEIVVQDEEVVPEEPTEQENTEITEN